MSISTEIKTVDFAALARAAEGLANWRGILVLIASLFLAGGVMAVGSYMAMHVSNGSMSAVLGLILGLISAAIALTGVSASGILLMDQARGVPQRSVADALIMAVMCIGKMIVVGLLVLAIVLLFMLAAAIIYFVCKIPGIGPLLLFIAHPILVVCAGLLFFSIGFVFMPLVAPSLWDGNSVKQAIAKLMAIVKSRFMLVIVNFIVLWLLVSIITFIVASIVFSGFTSMTGLAAMVLGSNVNVNLMQSTTQLFAGGGGGGEGYLWAATFSASIIFMVAAAMGIQVWLMGINLVYLNVSAGIDSSHAEALLDDQINHAKERAREAKQKAMEASERAKQKAMEAAERAKQSASQAQASSSASCPNCDATISPNDIFCESCGHKLK